MRLLILLMISIMTLPLFADEVKPAEKLPEVTKPIENVETTDKVKQPEITIIPGDGMNLAVEDMINPHYVVVKLNSPAHNWFAGQFKNLPTDKETAIGLSMDDNDTTGNKADVSKWKGLMPVMTYGDPTKYETYEWYTKDEKGRWVSGDLFKKGDDKYAGTGKVPTQTVIPKEAAEDFLSKDGKYWQPWREVDSAEALPNLNIFRIKQKFKFDTATVCMRIPFTYSYLQNFIDRINIHKYIGLTIDNIGWTLEGRRLQAITINPMSDININKKNTVVVIAREHATEHASSWGLMGALISVINDLENSNKHYENTNWIFIPVQDPDGSVNSDFDLLTEKFSKYSLKSPPEVYSYSKYFVDYVDRGFTIDVVISLHNVEANECSNIFSPINSSYHSALTVPFNQEFFDSFRNSNIQVSEPDKFWSKGTVSNRLYGWCSIQFNSFDLAFEINDRYPQNRLTLKNVETIGQNLSISTVKWLQSTTGNEWHQKVIKKLSERIQLRTAYRNKYGIKSGNQAKLETVVFGY
jgi:hypothetical protein